MSNLGKNGFFLFSVLREIVDLCCAVSNVIFKNLRFFLCENWIMGLNFDIFKLACVILPLALFIFRTSKCVQFGKMSSFWFSVLREIVDLCCVVINEIFKNLRGFFFFGENWIMGLYLDIFELLCVILPLGLFIRMALSWSEFACETGSKCDFQECGFFR